MAGTYALGKNLRIKIDDNTIYHATDCSFTSSLSTDSLATKDTNGELVSPGNYTWSISTSTLVAVKESGSSQNDTHSILTKFQAKELVAVEFTTDVADDVVISGEAYITQCDIAAPVNGAATFSMSATGSGDFVTTRVAS